MKARKILFAVMTIASVMLINSCGSDKACDGVTCSSHGTPTEILGICSCDCDNGYSGTDCDVEDLCIINNVSCLNGGVCDDGTCDCAAGYEGDSCQTESRDKFTGNFMADDDCTTSDYAVEIIESSTGHDKIVLKGFGKYLCAGAAPDVIATVDASDLTIAAQSFCSTQFSIDEGTGFITANTITINITYKTTGTDPQQTCHVVMARQ